MPLLFLHFLRDRSGHEPPAAPAFLSPNRQKEIIPSLFFFKSYHQESLSLSLSLISDSLLERNKNALDRDLVGYSRGRSVVYFYFYFYTSLLSLHPSPLLFQTSEDTTASIEASRRQSTSIVDGRLSSLQVKVGSCRSVPSLSNCVLPFFLSLTDLILSLVSLSLS